MKYIVATRAHLLAVVHERLCGGAGGSWREARDAGSARCEARVGTRGTRREPRTARGARQVRCDRARRQAGGVGAHDVRWVRSVWTNVLIGTLSFFTTTILHQDIKTTVQRIGKTAPRKYMCHS
jgi:hypothetical protein